MDRTKLLVFGLIVLTASIVYGVNTDTFYNWMYGKVSVDDKSKSSITGIDNQLDAFSASRPDSLPENIQTPTSVKGIDNESDSFFIELEKEELEESMNYLWYKLREKEYSTENEREIITKTFIEGLSSILENKLNVQIILDYPYLPVEGESGFIEFFIPSDNSIIHCVTVVPPDSSNSNYLIISVLSLDGNTRSSKIIELESALTLEGLLNEESDLLIVGATEKGKLILPFKIDGDLRMSKLSISSTVVESLRDVNLDLRNIEIGYELVNTDPNTEFNLYVEDVSEGVEPSGVVLEILDSDLELQNNFILTTRNNSVVFK